jgi:hypothetical protein
MRASHIACLARADGGQPVQPDGKDDQAVDRNHEGRNRNQADRQHAQKPVGQRIAPDHGGAAQKDAHDQRPAKGHHAKDQRVRKRLEDLVQNRAF